MKNVPNIITSFRMIGSTILLLFKPFSIYFMLIYTLCGVSDIIDGYIARKTKHISKTGAVLDSGADMVFTAVSLVVFLPVLPFTEWVICWIAGIFAVRISAYIIGFLKYHTFVSLHTYANKATGFILFCFPYVFIICGFDYSAVVILFVSSLSSIEEVIINLTSLTLDRDKRSIFDIGNIRR